MKLLVACAVMVLAQAAAADLRDEMSAEEFERAGLSKLTEQELEYLNRWLAGQAPVAPPAAESAMAPEEKFGLEQVAKPELQAADVPDLITARIKGEFSGWSGTTVFRLDNGQVWQQRLGGKLRTRKLQDPEVVVEKGAFGYYLRVVDLDRSIGVKRLR